MIKRTVQLAAWLFVSSTFIGANVSADDSGVLNPGDFGYPATNSAPKLVIPLTLSGPDWVQMQLHANYISDTSFLCGHVNILAGHFPDSVSVPINMTRAGDEYRGNIVVDRFNPGRCHWRFLDIEYGGWAAGVWNGLAVFAETGGLPVASEPLMEFWCYRVTYEDKPVQNCEELVQLRWSNATRAVSPEFFSQFTADEKGHSHVIRMSTQTKEIRVNLHDLNAIQGALIPVVQDFL